MLNTFYPDKTFHLFDKILDQPGCLCKIETANPESLYQRLARYQDYTGKAFYFWKEGQGLYRADIPNIFAPNTGSLIRALHHISLSMHFGMYLFVDVGNALKSPIAVQMLEQLVRKQDNQNKLLIFAGGDMHIPEKLDSYFTTIRHKVASNAVNSSDSLLVN